MGILGGCKCKHYFIYKQIIVKKRYKKTNSSSHFIMTATKFEYDSLINNQGFA